MNALCLLALVLSGQTAVGGPPFAAPGQAPPPADIAAPPQLLSAGGARPITPPGPSQPVFDPMTAENLRSDARLHDVAFVDPQTGWAVGDRGTIWHTTDGGRNWRLQDAGVGCPLYSVCFLDARTGWVAGGWTHPYDHSGVGVLLATRDGGQHWYHNPNLLLPALKRVRFFDAKRGAAVGCPSAMFPAGVLATDNGGQSWTVLRGGDGDGWCDGDFADLHTGALAGSRGRSATVRRSGIEPARMGAFGLRSLARLQLVPPAGGWLVGDGGLVMFSNDLGAAWQTPPALPPDEAARQFDFRALCVRGPAVWIAGAPGTRVFATPDAGRTWQVHPTGSRAPLEGLCFADAEHGWAVGDLGTILASDDGGRTWRTQRSGGTRAAVLALVAQSEDVPLELLARVSGNDGYLSIVEVLGRHDIEVAGTDEVPDADRAHQAVVGVGGCGADVAWQFPLRQAGLQPTAEQIVALWDRANDGRGLQEMQAHLAGQIRLWRPEIVVTHDAHPRGDDPLGHLVNQLVLQAVRDAADPTRFPQQITHAGLEPWSVKKVFAALSPGSRGSIEVTTSQLALRLGRSLAEITTLPRGLLASRFQMAPTTLGFRLLQDNVSQEQPQRDFFTGLALYPGGDARRQLGDPPSADFDSLRRIAEKRRNVQAILDRVDRDPRGGTQLLGQAGELTLGLDRDGAAQVLYYLGDRYYYSGRWDLAADTYSMLVERYPEHPLARPALLWLVQYFCGAEPAWRTYGNQRRTVQQTSYLAVDPRQIQLRAERAAGLGRDIERTRPDLFADPAIRFPLAAAARSQNNSRQAEKFYVLQGRCADSAAWKACADGEAWLRDPKGTSPKPIATCVSAAARPKLDGVLDDAVWQRAKAVTLQSPLHDDESWPAVVMLAYDREFLYVAVRCRQAPGADYAPVSGPRPRDADLSGRDRVEILLDLDRDYATYYRLAIDDRGWVAEDCWGDRTWNPNWFVAATTSQGEWSAEAAIPLDQLTGQYPAAKTVWALGVQRVVPGAGFQSWSTPAAATVLPEGFGYLVFE